MYIKDFLKKVFKKGNTTLLIYFLVNMLIVVGIIAIPFIGYNIFVGILVGLGLYAISVAASLSPIGEMMRRHQLHCIPLEKNPELEAELMPLINEVYDRAKEINPELPTDIRFFYLEDESINAFAAGRKTICLHSGTANMQDKKRIKAVLAHEFGHIANHDTDLGLFVHVGNLIINAFFIFWGIGVTMTRIIGTLVAIFTSDDDGGFAGLMMHLSALLSQVALIVIQKIWYRFGGLMIAKTKRNQEFEADIFSAKLGYGVPLCELFDTWGDDTPKDVYEGLFLDHPSSPERIENLQEFGVPFTGMDPEKRQMIIAQYRMEKKKKKKGCLIGCCIVMVLMLGAIISGIIGTVMSSRENDRHQEEQRNPEGVGTGTVLPQDEMEAREETVVVDDQTNGTDNQEAVEAICLDATNMDFSSKPKYNFIDASASSVVSQAGYDNSAMVAVDGLLETSWQEGVSGNGEGQYLEIYLDNEHPVKYLVFYLGNWRSYDWFYDNNRPQSLTIQIGDYTTTQEFADGQIIHCIELSQPIQASRVRLTINSVYGGRDWQDTCIAEVMAYGE
ncbi:MAG: M48 family metalloprotease [Lachnospiraceae bacterium]|nr:M48 family metalloprotease [Lachnospiraceae bacterium]